jgi:hypothetical protein
MTGPERFQAALAGLHLPIEWQMPIAPSASTPPSTAPTPTSERRRVTLARASLLAGSSWPGVAADVVLAVVVAKVILMGWVTYRRFSGNRVR